VDVLVASATKNGKKKEEQKGDKRKKKKDESLLETAAAGAVWDRFSPCDGKIRPLHPKGSGAPAEKKGKRHVGGVRNGRNKH